MSTTTRESITCPRCDREQSVILAESANVERWPPWRQKVLERSFMRFDCEGCLQRIVVERELLYADLPRGEFIAVFPMERRDDWQDLSHMIEQAFQQTFVTEAPGVVRKAAPHIRRRLVFGYEELREKVVCFAAGFDDRLLEALKLSLLEARAKDFGRGAFPVFDGLEPDGSLRFVHLPVELAGPEQQRITRVEQTAYHALAAEEERVETLLAPLWQGPYVHFERCVPAH